LGRRQTAGFLEAGEGQGPANLRNDARGPSLTLYLDTSAVLKVYLDEEGAAVVRAGVAASEVVASSIAAFVETRAAFARRRRAGELAPADHRRLVQEFGADWDRYLKLEMSEAIVVEAAELADRHRLRAYDAIHLASVLLLRERIGEAPTFACWDRELNTAAASEGLPLLR
jgi:predicted nucleic acid-binding protein